MSIDFTESEIQIVRDLVDGRWRDAPKDIHLADIEFTKKDEEQATAYPALVWEDKSTTFVILKLGAFSYKSFFYFGMDKRFDTGVDEYNDLNECADTLLKAQADFILSKSTQGLKVEINKD